MIWYHPVTHKLEDQDKHPGIEGKYSHFMFQSLHFWWFYLLTTSSRLISLLRRIWQNVLYHQHYRSCLLLIIIQHREKLQPDSLIISCSVNTPATGCGRGFKHILLPLSIAIWKYKKVFITLFINFLTGYINTKVGRFKYIYHFILIDINTLHVSPRSSSKRELGLSCLFSLPVLLRHFFSWNWFPGSILVKNDLIFLLRQFLGVDNIQEIPIEIQVLVESRAVTDRTLPGGLPLVHLNEQVGVKTLEMVTCRRATWRGHSHLS